MLKTIINLLLSPYRFVRDKIEYRKKLAELKKRDPFIYK